MSKLIVKLCEYRSTQACLEAQALFGYVTASQEKVPKIMNCAIDDLLNTDQYRSNAHWNDLIEILKLLPESASEIYLYAVDGFQVTWKGFPIFRLMINGNHIGQLINLDLEKYRQAKFWNLFFLCSPL